MSNIIASTNLLKTPDGLVCEYSINDQSSFIFFARTNSNWTALSNRCLLCYMRKQKDSTLVTLSFRLYKAETHDHAQIGGFRSIQHGLQNIQDLGKLDLRLPKHAQNGIGCVYARKGPIFIHLPESREPNHLV